MSLDLKICLVRASEIIQTLLAYIKIVEAEKLSAVALPTIFVSLRERGTKGSAHYTAFFGCPISRF